jgi:hypothetical protein
VSSPVVAIAESGQQVFINEAALESQNEDAAPDIAMAALFNIICKKCVRSGLQRTIIDIIEL